MADMNTNQNVGDNSGRVTGIDARGANTNRTDVNVTPGRNSPEMAELVRELRVAVFGDSMGWDGVLPRLRQIQKEMEELHRTVTTLQVTVTTLQHEVHSLKMELTERTETSHQMRLLLWIVAVGVTALVGIALWPLLT